MTKAANFLEKKDLIRKRLAKYTRKAFRMLPPLDRPRILDIGCGSGIPTMELARISNGEITGLDINEEQLQMLTHKARKANVPDRVNVMNCSIFDMDFPNSYFDIIWAEGSIAVMGFVRGLKEWKWFLKPHGFMVIHDEKGNVTEKLEHIAKCGYELLGSFTLTEDTWRSEYLAPLEKLVSATRRKHANDPKVMKEV